MKANNLGPKGSNVAISQMRNSLKINKHYIYRNKLTIIISNKTYKNPGTILVVFPLVFNFAMALMDGITSDK